MDSTRPGDVDINKVTLVIHHSLDENGMLPLPLVIVCGAFLRGYNGDMGTIYCPSTLRETMIVLESIND